MAFSDVFNLVSFQWFILGLVYMDFRGDHMILLGKTDDERLWATYYHYHVGDLGEPWYRGIMLTIFGVGLICTLYRLFKHKGKYDLLQLITSIANAVVFAGVIVPRYEQMLEMGKVDSPQKYLPHLRVVAMGHCGVLALSFISLFFAYGAYGDQHNKEMLANAKKSKSK